MSKLRNVDDAINAILETITPLDAETISTLDGLNRILADPIYADINLPPFANSSMDGYAIRAEDVLNASPNSPITLQVVMDIPAGKAPTQTLHTGKTARIMTGAPLPDGADAVIPVEDTNAIWRDKDTQLQTEVKFFRQVESGAYVRLIGEDIKQGDLILTAGTKLRPQEIGVLVSLGQSQINVIRQPRVVIISTGDELVGINDPLTAGKIRDSNTYTLSGLISEHGGIPLHLPVAKDTPEAIRELFQSALEQQPDMIISSAGVSVGAADYIRTILEEMGSVDFWRINLRPGKPLAYGQISGIPFFGLPGNPVSAMVTFDVLVRPALNKQAGYTENPIFISAILQEDIRSDGRRSFIRVKLSHKDGNFYATTTGTQSSGALMSMVLADGLMIIPEGINAVSAGSNHQVRLLKTDWLKGMALGTGG